MHRLALHSLQRRVSVCTQPYVALCDDPLRFTPGTESSVVFYDEGCQQVLVVQSAGRDSILSVLCLNNELCNFSYRLPNTKSLLSVKVSPDLQTVAVQRSPAAVEFFSRMDDKVFSQTSRGRGGSQILGFYWVTASDVVFVTKTDVELHQINTDTRSARLLKYYSVAVDWFIYSHTASLLAAYTRAGNILHTYHFRGSGLVTRHAKIDSLTGPGRPPLSEKDVCVALLYGRAYVLRTKNNVLRSSGHTGTEIELYHVTRDTCTFTCVLALSVVGSVALSFSDNLVLVHHQDSHTCSVFDIMHQLRGRPSRQPAGSVATHRPILLPSALKAQPALQSLLYSKGWVVFQPDVIIDSHHGYLWTLSLDLSAMAAQFTDLVDAIDFLRRRTVGRPVLLEVLARAVHPTTSTDLASVGAIMACVAAAVAQSSARPQKRTTLHLPQDGQGDSNLAGTPLVSPCVSPSPSTANLPAVGPDTGRNSPAPGSSLADGPDECGLTQEDILIHVLRPLESLQGERAQRHTQSVLVEYVRAMNGVGVTVAPAIGCLLVSVLASRHCEHIVRQLVHYRVISGSPELASHLMSLSETHPKLKPIAVDMMRLSPSSDVDMVDYLLDDHRPVDALRYAEKRGLVEKLPASDFLKVAADLHDPSALVSLVRHYQSLDRASTRQRERDGRVVVWRESLLFGCDEYVAMADGPK